MVHGVRDPRDRARLEQHFQDSGRVHKGSKMPAYKFDTEHMDAICAYLLQAP
jgi:hypothetical protein